MSTKRKADTSVAKNPKAPKKTNGSLFLIKWEDCTSSTVEETFSVDTTCDHKTMIVVDGSGSMNNVDPKVFAEAFRPFVTKPEDVVEQLVFEGPTGLAGPFFQKALDIADANKEHAGGIPEHVPKQVVMLFTDGKDNRDTLSGFSEDVLKQLPSRDLSGVLSFVDKNPFINALVVIVAIGETAKTTDAFASRFFTGPARNVVVVPFVRTATKMTAFKETMQWTRNKSRDFMKCSRGRKVVISQEEAYKKPECKVLDECRRQCNAYQKSEKRNWRWNHISSKEYEPNINEIARHAADIVSTHLPATTKETSEPFTVGQSTSATKGIKASLNSFFFKASQQPRGIYPFEVTKVDDGYCVTNNSV